MTVLDNDLRCGVAAGYCRGIHIRNTTVTAIGNIIEGGEGTAAGVSAVGVMVAGDTARVRLVNNLIVGGRGADVAGVRIDGDVSMTDIVLLAHNVIVGGFNVNSSRTTGIVVDQTAHAVVVNNIIDGGRGVPSRGLYPTPNLLTDDRRGVLLHNDIWGLGQTHPAGNDVADRGAPASIAVSMCRAGIRRRSSGATSTARCGRRAAGTWVRTSVRGSTVAVSPVANPRPSRRCRAADAGPALTLADSSALGKVCADWAGAARGPRPDREGRTGR